MGKTTFSEIPSFSPEFATQVKLGNVPGWSSGEKFGYSQDVSGGANDICYAVTGNYGGFPTVPDTVNVTSTAPNDRTPLDGAHTVLMSGLDASGDYQEEILNLNGVTPVTSVNSWSRLNRMKVLTAGATGINVGQITASATGNASVVFAVIGSGINQSLVGALTVAANKEMYVLQSHVGITRMNGSPGSAVYSLRARPPGGVFNSIRYQTIGTSYSDDYESKAGLGPFSSGTDLKFRIESASDSQTDAFCQFEYLLRDV